MRARAVAVLLEWAPAADKVFWCARASPRRLAQQGQLAALGRLRVVAGVRPAVAQPSFSFGDGRFLNTTCVRATRSGCRTKTDPACVPRPRSVGRVAAAACPTRRCRPGCRRRTGRRQACARRNTGAVDPCVVGVGPAVRVPVADVRGVVPDGPGGPGVEDEEGRARREDSLSWFRPLRRRQR